ncbi:hypothetical protein R1flu_012768 [Riccia fluitans]|uniref:Cytochrome P450 n=1 Tax=Riccia fluitans TaxID=41844 RepID=A0ABD1ZBW5_9MARC
MFVPGDVYSFLRKLHIGGVEAALLRLAKEMDDLFTIILEEHRNKAEADNETNSAKEIRTLLIFCTETVSAQVILDHECDTMRHPEVVQKLQKEMDSLVRRERSVKVSDFVHMKYLDVVIKECIRLHPGFPLGAHHESIQATKVAGHDISVGP